MYRSCDSAGQALVEYAVILIFVGLMIVVLVGLAGPALNKIFSSLTTAI